MLARVAGRSLRLYRVPVQHVQVPISYLQSRSYAKNKPKRSFEYRPPTDPNASNEVNTSNLAGPMAGTIGRQAGRPDLQGSQSDIPDTTKLQEEYDAIISARSANQTSIPQHTSGPTSTNSAESYPHPDHSRTLDEFDTSSTPDGSSTPHHTTPSLIDPAEARSQEEGQQTIGVLPDLTQGIPSTLDTELTSSARANPASLNVTESPSQPGGSSSSGRLPNQAYISSIERRRDRYVSWALAAIGVFIVSQGILLGRNWDSEEEEKKHPDAPSGWGIGLYWNRVKARWRGFSEYYTEPTFPKLLPDVDPAWERPYTLVISLEDMLVHSEWTREHGWRTAKRPGVDYFLRYLSQYYELVIFTSVPSMMGHPIIQKLDPYRIVMWPLFREATKYQGGEYIKV